ncbi:MAG: M20/M25/M40 family metallo-hydrolase, partial [Candidatus Methylomirabilales bacterium]
MIDPSRVSAFVRRNGRRFVDTLKEACSIPSISAEGRGLPEMAGWVEAKLKDLGARTGRLEVPGAPPVILGEIPGAGGRTLMIYDHYDVQPVDPPDLWETAPFDPDEREGRIYARGAADNKGDLVARLCALEAFRETVGELPHHIKLVVEGEEEIGSPHFDEVCRTFAGRLAADHCVWEGAWFENDGRPQVVYGCKGLLYLELGLRRLSADQHSSQAVYAPSAAWELVRAIASMRDEAGRVSIDGFYDDVEQEPPDAELVRSFAFDEESELKRLRIDHFLGQLTGEDLRREILHGPTANIAGLCAGYALSGAKTVLPAEASAKMDFRLVPHQDARDIASKIRRHLDEHGFDEVRARVLAQQNPSRSPRGSDLGVAVERAAADWFPKPVSIWPLMLATGPMHPIAQELGIPICSPPGVTRPDSHIHAPNENVRVEDFLDIVGFT